MWRLGTFWCPPPAWEVSTATERVSTTRVTPRRSVVYICRNLRRSIKEPQNCLSLSRKRPLVCLLLLCSGWTGSLFYGLFFFSSFYSFFFFFFKHTQSYFLSFNGEGEPAALCVELLRFQMELMFSVSLPRESLTGVPSCNSLVAPLGKRMSVVSMSWMLYSICRPTRSRM